MKNVEIIIVFLAKFFDIMPTVKEEEIAGILNIGVSNLKVGIEFIMLNNFAIVLQLN